MGKNFDPNQVDTLHEMQGFEAGYTPEEDDVVYTVNERGEFVRLEVADDDADD